MKVSSLISMFEEDMKRGVVLWFENGLLRIEGVVGDRLRVDQG